MRMNQATEAKKPMMAAACSSVVTEHAPQAIKKTHRASEVIDRLRIKMNDFMTRKV
jgi:hypothetical protein